MSFLSLRSQNLFNVAFSNIDTFAVHMYSLYDEILLNSLSVFVEPSNGKDVNGLAHLPRIFFLMSDSNDMLLSIVCSQRSISLNNLHHHFTSLCYSYSHTFVVSPKNFNKKVTSQRFWFPFLDWNISRSLFAEFIT